MTELFEPSEREKRREEAEREEGEAGSNFAVQLFFFAAIAGGLYFVSRWLVPGQGPNKYLLILAASYYSTWLFNKFLKRS
jgi:hypothetical protein